MLFTSHNVGKEIDVDDDKLGTQIYDHGVSTFHGVDDGSAVESRGLDLLNRQVVFVRRQAGRTIVGL